MRVLLTATAVAMVLLATGCSDDEPEHQRAEPPPPETTASTTTSTTTTEVTTTTVDPDAPVFEPLLIDPALDPEAQVEAAYIHHWDILMDAVELGRTSNLHLAYSDAALGMREGEVEHLISEGLRFGGHVEHNYAITIHAEDQATVMDGYWNHLHRVAPESGEAISEASGDQVLREFDYVKEGSQWKVHLVTRHTFS